MYIYVFVYIYIPVYIYAAVSNGKRSTEPRAIFLHSFTVYSSCTWKFIVCPLRDEETNGSYSFANRLNGLDQLADKLLFTREPPASYFS